VRRQDIVIVTPALADANNGDWQTARRWARILHRSLGGRHAAIWDGGDRALMTALHACRSAAFAAAWRAHHPRAPQIVALTGTDLCRGTASDPSAQASK
jgi:hypothetical protein